MGRVTGSANRTVLGILVVLALASLSWSAIALFYPYKVSVISGTLDSGEPYSSQFYTLAYNSVGGYLLLLAAIINMLASVELVKTDSGLRRGVLWALFSAILLGSIGFVGDTVIISWLSDIPSDIQHGIGTPYVTLTETMKRSIPALIGKSFAWGYIVLMSCYYVVAIKSRHGLAGESHNH